MQTPDKRKYSLRLKERFAWYDTVGSQMWHDFPAGAEITDQSMIELLELRHAPTEKIYEGEFRR
jgi:hypothetical protein